MGATFSPTQRYSAQSRQSSFYLQLRDQLLDSLVRAAQPGDRVPSERQLAKQFDTSTVTIARILQEFQENGFLMRVPGKGTFICEASSAGVSAFLESGTEAPLSAGTPVEFSYLSGLIPRGNLPPSPSLSGLVERATRSLRHTCIVMNVTTEPAYLAREYWTHRVVSTVERSLQRHGGKTTLVNRKQLEAGGANATLDRLLAEGVDSVIYQGDGCTWIDAPKPNFDWDREMLRLWEKSGGTLTIAQVNLSGRSKAPFDMVSYDGIRGSFIATRHLLDLGHRDICFLSRSVDYPWIQERIEGFWQALELAGVSTGEEFFNKDGGGGRIFCSAAPPPGSQDWDWASRDVARRFFEGEGHRDYTAAVALNDEIASAFVEEAGRRGLRVPEDFSIIGFDDRLESKGIGLTTIHLPIEEIGDSAVSLMIQRHNEPFESGKIEMVLNPSLVMRSTTRQRPQQTN